MQKVILGDSFELIRDIIREVKNPIIVTDPPFNIGYHYDEYNDRKKEDDYFSDLGEMFQLCPSVVIHYPEPLYKIAYEMGMFPERVVSWVYNSNTGKQHRDIAYFNVTPNFKGLGEYKNPNDKRIKERIAKGLKPRGYDWIYCDQVKNVSKDKTEHPCQMPIKVMDYIIATLPKESTIIDPFAGSGTTLLAAKNAGLDYVGIEMSEKYVEIINNRLKNI